MNLQSRNRRRLAMLASTILMSGLAAPAMAASPHPNLDLNGVDLTEGTFNLRLPIASIGSGQTRLDLVAIDARKDNYSQIQLTRTVFSGTTTITIDMGTHFDTFKSTDGFAQSTRGTGATLTINSAESITYRTLEGVVIQFGNPAGPSPFGGYSNLCDAYNSNGCSLLPQSISGRSGMSVDFDWTVSSSCSEPQNPDDPVNCTHSWRLGKVSNDAGYSIEWTFASASPASLDWFRRTSAVLKNANVSASSWPTVTYGAPSGTVNTITTPGGKTWRITGSGLITAIRRPSAGSDTTTISYTSGKVSSVTADGVTTGYNYSLSGSTATMVVTDAQSNATTIVSDMNKFRPTSVTNALSKTTSMTYDSIGRPTEIAYPEGNKVQYAYDARGNVTTTTYKAKSGSGLSDLVETANYDTTCTNVATCNQPNWTKDAKNNQTDYTYDTTTGLPLTVTSPAASGGANRPQTRYSYTASSGVSLLTGVSRCQTGVAPGCVGTADEMKTTIAYTSNMLPSSVSEGAGDASLTATTATTYDEIGNTLTVDGPISGSADTMTYRYDADRARLGAISPDPDGAGARVRSAVKTTYNSDGQPTVTELGTVNGTSNSDWAAFSTAQQSTTTYDANARATKSVVTSGGTTYAVTQMSYDSVGQLECTAQRMNSAVWGSLPGSACTLQTTGSYGADRIAKTVFDAVGRVSKVQTAYGTSDQADEVTNSYTNNGQLATVKDGEANLTTYEYDGFDRLLKTRYPSTTQGAGTSSTTDYEQLTYDANSNVTQLRLRDGQTIGFTYDNLDRSTFKDLPGSEPDVTYTYDLLGRMTQASQTGHTISFGYDALSRKLSETGPLGTMTSQYDIAGRRTAIVWPDSAVTTYTYDTVGSMAGIYEGAGTSVWMNEYVYDNLGRRTALNRRYGANTSYSYDAVSRLSSLAHDLPGSSGDITIGSFAYNPASQITSLTRSNDAYAWGGHYNEDRSATLNGLNQQSGISNATTSTSVSFTHDGRGNITAIGTGGYTYSSENLLRTGPGSTSLSYDPLGRLYEVSDGSTTTRFQYDGGQIAAEYNASNTRLRRYVPGPGQPAPAEAGEPAFWYEGSGIGPAIWYHSDERGSVIALSNQTSVVAINSYDAYGKPASGNLGRFGYTGQAWLPELGMWYYKARIYNPTNNVARFMQGDPIGYSSGMNIYAYVAGDPVNKSDPSGMLENSDTSSHSTTCTGSRISGACGSGGPAGSFSPGNSLSFSGDSPGGLSSYVPGTPGSSTTDAAGNITVTAGSPGFYLPGGGGFGGVGIGPIDVGSISGIGVTANKSKTRSRSDSTGGRPKFCSSQIYKLLDMGVGLGKFGSDVGGGMMAFEIVFGEPGLGGAEVEGYSSAAALGFSFMQTFYGDRQAFRRTGRDVLNRGALRLVPSNLRNGFADYLFGKAVDAALPGATDSLC